MNTFRKLSKYIRRHRGELILGMIALLVTDLLGLCAPWLIKCAIDSIETVATARILIKYAFLIVAVITIQAVFRFCWRKYLFGLSRKVEYDLRNDLFLNLQRQSASFFLRRKTGDLMSRATNDMVAVREFLGLGSMIMVDTVVTVSTSLGMMFVINSRLALMALCPMLVISLLVVRFGKLIRKRYTDVQAQLAKVSAMVQESISGIRVVQAYVQEKSEQEKFDKLNREYIRKNIRLVKISGILFPLLTLMSGISAAIVLWFGGMEVIGGAMTLGSFVAFNGYLAMLTWPMMAIGFMTNLMQRGAASMERIDVILKAEPDIPNVQIAGDGIDTGRFLSNRWDIEFRDVGFTYPGAGTKALSGINVKIATGSTLGIVGQVGSGKSTVGKLISRMYDVDCGSITVNGVDIRNVPIAILRKSIGYVEQDPFLFADSIRENIAFGLDNEQSLDAGRDLDDMTMDAAIAAGLEKDIESFTDNIDTRIGERGVTLSGGQKQRVAIARALLRNARVLILDDAFSSLDTKTESTIFNRIRNAGGRATTIFISHRISTVRNADLIVVLDNGEIVEMGTHGELVDLEGVYCNIYRHQMMETDVGVVY